MSYHPLLQPLFTRPSHRRDELLLGFGFGLIFVGLYIFTGQLLVVPFGYLPCVFLLKGCAEAFPRSWIMVAGIVRLAARFIAVIGGIWTVLLTAGWLLP